MDAAKATTTNNENDDQSTTSTSAPGAVSPPELDATAGTPSEPVAPTPSIMPMEPGGVPPTASASGANADPGAAGASLAGPNAWQRMRSTVLNPENRWFLPLLGLVAYLLMLLTNFLANWLPFNDQMTGDVINKQPIPFQPAGWAFLIWIVIYILLGIYVVYALTPAGQRSRRVRRIGGLFIISCAANIAWLFLWHWEQFLLALIAILILWASLLGIYILARLGDRDGSSPSAWQKAAIQVPFSVYLGWASIATLAGFAVWANRSWHTGNPFSDRIWAVILLLVGILIAGAFALFGRDVLVPLVVVWAYVGIIQQQWEASTLVVVVAVIGAIASAALTVAAWSLRFNPDTLQRLTPRRRSPRPPAAPTA